MRITYTLFSVLILQLIVGCRSYSSVEMNKPTEEKTTTKIHPLDLRVNNTSSIDALDKVLYEKEMISNVFQISAKDSSGLDKENMGIAELSVISHKSARNPLLSVFCTLTSFGTLRTAALLGIPVGHRKGVTELSLAIKNQKGEVISQYDVKGQHTSFVTCYWGYKTEDAEKKALDKSFQKAVIKLKSQLSHDANDLNKLLPIGMLDENEINVRNFGNTANAFYEKKNYSNAIQNYLKAIEFMKPPKSKDALSFYKLGMCFFNEAKDSSELKSIKYFTKSLELNPTMDYEVPVSISLAYKRLGDVENEVKWLDYTLNKFVLNSTQKDLIVKWKNQSITRNEQIIAGSSLKLKPENVIVSNLGTKINGRESDYFPSVTADESMLLFTSNREGSTGGLNKQGSYDEDLWYCIKTPQGTWSAPSNFGTPINTKKNNGIASFTGDGQYVVCGRCNEIDGLGSCDIYGAILTGNSWGTPINLGPIINSKAWDAQVSISTDGKTIIWASNREGGLGEQDLWISKKNESGVWSPAKNLGNTINTDGNEYSPFLHPDGKTLYFSSNNHSPRIGGIDIYKSSLAEDGTWSKPENLGYPINTESNDLYYVLTPSSLKAYLGSDRSGGYGSYDIYEVSYPVEKKSSLITFVGNVLNEESKIPLEANIIVEDIDSSSVVGEYLSNSSTGKFVVILTPGRNYSLTVSKNGYLFYSENFNVVDTAEFKVIRKEILLQQIKEGKKIVLNNIFFQTGKSELTESSALEISKLYDLLKQNPTITVEISGHTDDVGSDANNLKLSLDRATVVVAELVNKGVQPSRLIARGYGKTQPVVPNDTPENRQLNRRTEFKILGYNKN
jgi:outer membrane protein OmpA-like peptidoglycan-associated protein/tetratricopeptide (TPR) repeat protein